MALEVAGKGDKIETVFPGTALGAGAPQDLRTDAIELGVGAADMGAGWHRRALMIWLAAAKKIGHKGFTPAQIEENRK